MSTIKKLNCQSCEEESYTRNHYFNGKLMVERDFTDEQRYFMEKIRIHHKRLHGHGVVCGLQIEAHDESCDQRYVILQPGSAIDCCGKDVLVTQPEVIDLWAFPEIQELIAESEASQNDPDAVDSSTHRLQLCIRYKECPTENIPVLYDECGCDDTQCAPNRILESFEVDLIIDPELPINSFNSPVLNWQNTINLAHAEHIVLHEASNRLYVITADDNGTVYQVSTDNFSIECSFSLERKGLALTTNQSGEQLYLVVAHKDGVSAGNAELWIFDTLGTDLANGAISTGEIPDSADSAASIQLFSDDRLLVLLGDNGARLRLWDAGVATPDTPSNQLDMSVNLNGISLGSDGLVYAAEPSSANVHTFNIDVAGLDPKVINAADSPVDMAFFVMPVISTGTDLLAVLDDVNQSLRLIEPSAGGSVIAGINLDYKPKSLAVSQGGHWGYVLLADGDNSYIQTINLQALRQGTVVNAGEPIKVGNHSSSIVLTASGSRAFVPYPDLSVDNAGGVSVIDIKEKNCAEILWEEECPECESPDCVTLATIENYRINHRVLDEADPKSDEVTDLSNSISRINNQLGRQRLPSTQAIANALACVIENCCGQSFGDGEQGPPGKDGVNGIDGIDGIDGTDGTNGIDGADGTNGVDGKDAQIDDVVVNTIPCGEPAAGEISETASGDVILSLDIPSNCHPNLVHICNISWIHAGELSFSEFIGTGIRLRFDGEVNTADIHPHSVRMLIGRPDEGFVNWSELSASVFSPANDAGENILEIVPLIFTSDICSLAEFKESPDADFVNGVMLRFTAKSIEQILNDQNGELADLQIRIQILGDFIRDKQGLALDGDHLPDWVPARVSGNHIPGGTFESWFTMKDVPFTQPSRDNPNGSNNLNSNDGATSINSASLDELIAINGIGPEIASAIVDSRVSSPFTSEKDLLRISGIGQGLINKIRNQINFNRDGE